MKTITATVIAFLIFATPAISAFFIVVDLDGRQIHTNMPGAGQAGLPVRGSFPDDYIFAQQPITPQRAKAIKTQIITPELRRGVTKVCEDKFPGNYYMIENCTKLHLESMRWLSDNARDAGILRQCSGSFPNNPYMIKSCYQLQEESKKRLYQ